MYVHPNFIWNYIKDVTVKIQFSRSEENLADQFTKNLSNGNFQFLTSRYVYHERRNKIYYHYIHFIEVKHTTLLSKGDI